MKRRGFITLFGGAAVTWPLAARAQQPDRVRRIGVLMGVTKDEPEGQARIAALREGLQKLGWIDGRNIRIEERWADGGIDSVRIDLPYSRVGVGDYRGQGQNDQR